MALLKEDGSLDVEHINKLPLEEYMDTIGDLSEEQYEEYLSKLPINESNEPIRVIKVDRPMGVNADDVINKIKEFINELEHNKQVDKDNGEKMTLSQLAEKYNIPKYIVYNRYKAKWSIEDIINKPIDVTKRSKNYGK